MSGILIVNQGAAISFDSPDIVALHRMTCIGINSPFNAGTARTCSGAESVDAGASVYHIHFHIVHEGLIGRISQEGHNDDTALRAIVVVEIYGELCEVDVVIVNTNGVVVIYGSDLLVVSDDPDGKIQFALSPER